jgi:hypothetical protein
MTKEEFMSSRIESALLVGALAIWTASAMADDTSYPRRLGAAEVQKLYGDREVRIDAGKLNYDVKPDGTMIGHNTALIGGAAVQAGTSNGKWRVDTATGKICHDLDNGRWMSGCFVVTQTGDGSYEWSPTGSPGGMKFTVTPH